MHFGGAIVALPPQLRKLASLAASVKPVGKAVAHNDERAALQSNEIMAEGN